MSAIDELRRRADELTPEPPKLPIDWPARTRKSFARHWPILIQHIHAGKSWTEIARELGGRPSTAFVQANRVAMCWLAWRAGLSGGMARRRPCLSGSAPLDRVRLRASELPASAPKPPRDWKPGKKAQFLRGWPMLVAHVVEGLTLDEVGAKFGISRQRAHQIVQWTASNWPALEPASAEKSAPPRTGRIGDRHPSSSLLSKLRPHPGELPHEPPKPLSHWSSRTRRSFVRNWPILFEHIHDGKSLAAIARELNQKRGAIFIQAVRVAERWLEWKESRSNGLGHEEPSGSEAAALDRIRECAYELPIWVPEPPRDWGLAEKMRFARGWLMLIDHVAEGLPLAEVGTKYGISRQRAHRIIKWTAARWLEWEHGQKRDANLET